MLYLAITIHVHMVESIYSYWERKAHNTLYITIVGSFCGVHFLCGLITLILIKPSSEKKGYAKVYTHILAQESMHDAWQDYTHLGLTLTCKTYEYSGKLSREKTCTN